MTIQDQIVTALATAAATIVTAMGAWVVTWVQRKVRENEEANLGIAAQSLANSGSMNRLDTKMDGLHETINGGQLPAIVQMAIANSDAVKTLTQFAEHNRADITELKELTASMCRFGAAGKSHAPGGSHCPDHVDGTPQLAPASSTLGTSGDPVHVELQRPGQAGGGSTVGVAGSS